MEIVATRTGGYAGLSQQIPTLKRPGQAGLIPQITVLIADDHALFRQGLAMLLAQDDAVQVVGEAADGFQTISIAETLQPNILLLDIGMPGLGGVEALSLIRKRAPRTRVLILCDSPDDESIIQTLQLGAKGYLSKTLVHQDLVRAIRTTHSNGEIWAERKILTQVLESLRLKVHGMGASLQEAQESLTARERDVVQWVLQGMTNKEIAVQLGIADKTVKTHLSNIFNKLKISRRLQLVLNRVVE